MQGVGSRAYALGFRAGLGHKRWEEWYHRSMDRCQLRVRILGFRVYLVKEILKVYIAIIPWGL